MTTDSELDRSLSRTGPGKIENPHDIIEIDIAMIGAAYPTEMNKPMTMADVAGAGGPAVTGAGGPAVTRAGGPVVAGTRFLAVAEEYSPVTIEKSKRVLVPQKRKLVPTR